jgi:hypothetical protein
MSKDEGQKYTLESKIGYEELGKQTVIDTLEKTSK